MRISGSLQSKLNTILWITIAWTLISDIQLIYDVALIREYGFEYRWSTEGNFMTYFVINTFIFVLNGIIGGLVVVFFLQGWIRNRSYRLGLLYGILVYSTLFFLLTCVQNFFVIRSIWDGTGSFLEAYLKGLEDYFFSYEFVRLYPFWLLVLSLTLTTLFISDNFGPGIFLKFLLGKYFKPKREERIFMFLDLKGATTIAEELGEMKYFTFIRQVLKDVTPAIVKYRGEIYQYVGDEIVITWNLKRGLADHCCIRCFYDIRQRLKDLEPYYKEEFGVAPEYKAGLHAGTVTVGEIGVIKREIAYSGDVMNTTARIQNQCNAFNVSILISEDLLNMLGKKDLSARAMGEVELKGKAEPVRLFSVLPDDQSE